MQHQQLIQLIPQEAVIRPWVDPVVDVRGFDPRGSYAERYWLSVIGPTASWILRRFADCFDAAPEGFVLDLGHTARTMGLSFEKNTASPFGKALHRCVMFGVAHPVPGGLAIRRRLPQIANRHLRRLPDAVRELHDAWVQADIVLDDLGRAHLLATAMLDAGDEPWLIEHQLVALAVSPPVAAVVADNVTSLCAATT